MIQITEEQRQLILRFLDRVPLQGLKEVESMNRVLMALAPKKEKS